MSNIIRDSFVCLPIYNFFGFFQYETVSFRNKLKAYFFCCIFTILPAILGLIQWIFHPEQIRFDFSRLFVIACLTYTPKCIILIYRQRQIGQCLHYFSHPYFLPSTKKQKQIIEKCVRRCRVVSTLYPSVLLVTTVIAIILPSFQATPKLPINFWLPYNPQSNKLLFYLTNGAYTVVVLYNGLCGSTTDVLLAGLAYHAVYQLKMLNFNLQHLQQEKLCLNLLDCIKRHRAMLSFVLDYEKCFSKVILCEFAAFFGGVAIMVADVLLTPIGSSFAIVSIIASHLLMFKLFFYCYSSQLVFEEHQNIATSIYMGIWYKFDIQAQKTLLFVMERAQTPLTTTIGYVIDLTLETFVKMLKSLYSFVALLHKFQT